MHFLLRAEKPKAKAVESVQVPVLRDAELAAIYYGERTGGDFYDFFRASPDRVIFGLLDVAGRKEQNLAIVSAAQQTFRAMGQELLRPEDVNEAEAMVELALQLNRTILSVGGGVHSCPAFAGCYNESLGIVCYFNAGHTPALLRDATGVTELPATGLPLGLFSHATVDAPMAALPPGAALLLVSRGVVEATCKGEELGIEGVKEHFQRSTAATAKELCVDTIDSVRQFMCRPPTHNDVTVLALRRERNGAA